MVNMDVTKNVGEDIEDTKRIADMTPKQLGECIRWNVFMGIFGAQVILGGIVAVLYSVLRELQ